MRAPRVWVIKLLSLTLKPETLDPGPWTLEPGPWTLDPGMVDRRQSVSTRRHPANKAGGRVGRRAGVSLAFFQ